MPGARHGVPTGGRVCLPRALFVLMPFKRMGYRWRHLSFLSEKDPQSQTAFAWMEDLNLELGH